METQNTMGRKKVHWMPKGRFGFACGKYSSNRKSTRSGKPTYVDRVTVPKSNDLKIKLTRHRVRKSYQRVVRNLLQNVNRPASQFHISKVHGDNLKYNITSVKRVNAKGCRMMNIDCLQTHVSDVTMHVAICDEARDLVSNGRSPVTITSELRTYGLASVLLAKCEGCGKEFKLETSPKLTTEKGKRYDIKVRAVWGCATTGNGAAHLNELLATMDSPGISQPSFTAIEQEIGDWWEKMLRSEFMAAGAEERRIAIEKGNFHQGVPCITVIADGGWNKRSHKHSYNALGGAAVIIGKETGRILHLGVRNKYCYICSRAENNKVTPKPHRCFKNWNDSSQAMEADMIVEGFQKAEAVHGVRYTRLIADGDSSVFARIQEEVPVWGKDVCKEECANHVCKCLRSSLKKMVDTNPQFKGKSKLSKGVRVRLVSAVRCAIRMRSKENDKSAAVKTLAHDIRNSVHHIFGKHTNCSDFCKARTRETNNSDTGGNIGEAEEQDNLSSMCDEQIMMWTEGSSIDDQEKSRLATPLIFDVDSAIMKEVSCVLDRVAVKSSRLLENTTTNLAECWMHVRSKFDGGKVFHNCSRGSWHTRCFGGSLRMNLGPQWSPVVWENVTGTVPGHHYCKLYEEREKQLKFSTALKKKPEASASRWKRKMKSVQLSRTKKARLAYGSEAIDVVDDLTTGELEKAKDMYLPNHINISNERIDAIERMTKEQSNSSVERRKAEEDHSIILWKCGKEETKYTSETPCAMAVV